MKIVEMSRGHSTEILEASGGSAIEMWWNACGGFYTTNVMY